MVRKKLYRYFGRNGFVTTYIFLDGVNHVPMYRLEAEKGMILTDGEKYRYVVEIFAEDLEKWQEVPKERADNLN